MNSKLRTELLKLVGHDDGVEFGDGYHDDTKCCPCPCKEAEKAIRQAVGEEMLMLVGKQRPYKGGSYSYWEGEKFARAELRQRIKQWQGGKDE